MLKAPKEEVPHDELDPPIIDFERHTTLVENWLAVTIE